MDQLQGIQNNQENQAPDQATLEPSQSIMKKDLGINGLIVTSYALSAVSWFLPVLVSWFVLFIAALVGVICLIRTIKMRNGGLIFVSVLSIVIPIIIYFLSLYWLSPMLQVTY